MHAETCLLLRNLCANCDFAVTWHILPPNRCPSFEVSAMFPLHEIDDIFAYGKGRQMEV